MIGCMTITAAADGSSLGNPGPTGWGWFIDDDRWAAGGQRHGTNNIGELSAVIDLLRQAADVDDLVILCDSKYVIDSITKWMPGWKRKGWKKADGKPVLNVELMQELDRLMDARAQAGAKVRFEWVKGHAGHPLNEEADRLANGAAAAIQRGQTPDAGPGLGKPLVQTDAASNHGHSDVAVVDAAPAAGNDADVTLFDDELEPAVVEESFELARDLRLTVWRDAQTHEVLNHRLEQLGGEGWLTVS